ncbi:hypothetical protein PHLCEN_2v10086 [Hermanssonia centrifuga]|uniref:tRNA (guanine(26)-N(2))-dimethyltransferase n=1 Tax=Hermanssonia centrifuga TaxID=98765 RepID=A0A2R6NNV7_9APHY|nr:hypothetical protein PHLCEN_2v10086 [Hermanssonia centrifuga]
MSTQAQPTIIVPAGFSLHSENTAHILLPNDNGAFLNPVQEFNRDLSVACIRTWGDQMNELRRNKWAKKLQKNSVGPSTSEDVQTTETSPAGPSAMLVDAAPQIPDLKPHKFVILEALSATGLRSIRYAKEIPLVKYVIANDLSSSATEAMRRNVEINGLGPQPIIEVDSTEPLDGKQKTAKSDLGKVRVNEGDAWYVIDNVNRVS